MKNFIRKTESFRCRNCGFFVEGTGYTNHCPKCLYSRHVDLEIPGDRGDPCHGMMKPVGVEMKKGEYVLVHKCQKCGKITRNKTARDDNFELFYLLSQGRSATPV